MGNQARQPSAAIQDSAVLASKRPAVTGDGRFDIVIKPDPTIWDGRFINNGWLQELPKPLTHTVWDNAAWIAPADAERLKLINGDVVSIGETTGEGGTIELPVWIVPGHATGCMTLFAGYGRRIVGRVGKGAGFDLRALVVAAVIGSMSLGGRAACGIDRNGRRGGRGIYHA